MTKIAQNMAEQNETMLAGIQAAARYSNMGMDGEPLTSLLSTRRSTSSPTTA